MKTHARAILTATAAVAAATLIGAPAADAKPAPNPNLNESYCVNVLGASSTATYYNIVKGEKQCVITTSEVTYGPAEPTSQASADGTLLLTYGTRLVTTSRVGTAYIQLKSQPIRSFVNSSEVVSTTSENIDILCFHIDSTGGSTPTAVADCTAAGLLPN